MFKICKKFIYLKIYASNYKFTYEQFVKLCCWAVRNKTIVLTIKGFFLLFILPLSVLVALFSYLRIL